MRQRLRTFRPRSMARRPGDDERFTLSPRARRLGGWLAALVLVIGIAVAVGVLGGNGDGAAIAPVVSGSPSARGPVAAVAFGTEIDPVTGEVAESARTDRFAAGDTFAYSVRPPEPPPPVVHVEVRRADSDEVVQPAAAAAQALPQDARIIAFSVPAANLVSEFGTGEFTMIIFADPAGSPLARGEFELVDPSPSGSAAP